MKIIKEYEETDKIGTHLVKEQSNGIKVRLLKKPSKWYADKQKVNADKFAIRELRIKKEQDKQNIINERIKQIAIEQLKDENILDMDGNLIEK